MNFTKPQTNTNSEHSFSFNRFLDDQCFSKDMNIFDERKKTTGTCKNLIIIKTFFVSLADLFHFKEHQVLLKMLHK